MKFSSSIRISTSILTPERKHLPALSQAEFQPCMHNIFLYGIQTYPLKLGLPALKSVPEHTYLVRVIYL